MSSFYPSSFWWKGAPYPPRAWQSAALPQAISALEAGQRGLVHAVMGAGKSVFIAEMVKQLDLEPGEVILVSAPTVKLVSQLSKTVGLRRGLSEVGCYYTHAKQTRRPVIVSCNPSLPELAKVLRASGKRVALWIVDEAHSSECASLHEAYAALEPARLLGMTATPYRADTEQALSLFDTLVYSYGPSRALADGVIVPWRVRHYQGGASLLDDACVEMIRCAVREGLGPGVVDAHSWVEVEGEKKQISGIMDAEAFASRLCAEGIRAEAVHCERKGRAVDRALRRLEHGELDCLVHVALLKEGVDLPWLRWLCLRRQVASRVWFAQHVGRALRSYPGKEVAHILDPGDLFGTFGLSYSAVLGGSNLSHSPLLTFVPEAQDGASGATPTAKTAGKTYALSDAGPKVLGRLGGSIRQVMLAMEAAGYLSRKEQVAAGPWRHQPVSKRQLETIQKASRHAARKMDRLDTPDDVRELLRYSYANAPRLTKGAASDLLDVLFGLAKARQSWPDAATQMIQGGGGGADA